MMIRFAVVPAEQDKMYSNVHIVAIEKLGAQRL
jgi:hypothetical protein